MSHTRRGRAVHTQMPTDRTPSTHASAHAEEFYTKPPFSKFKRDVGPSGIPLKIFETHGERLPKDHPPGQTSAMSARGTPSPGQRRFGKAV